MSDFSGIVHNAASATENVQSGLDTIDRFSSIVEPLRVFNSIANGIANVTEFISLLVCG
jgi:hypothetical protein